MFDFIAYYMDSFCSAQAKYYYSKLVNSLAEFSAFNAIGFSISSLTWLQYIYKFHISFVKFVYRELNFSFLNNHPQNGTISTALQLQWYHPSPVSRSSDSTRPTAGHNPPHLLPDTHCQGPVTLRSL